jgi:hypothetical protein
MEPNPAPSDNGEIEEKPRLHAHTTSGHGSCAIIIKIEMEREMVNSKPLARLENYPQIIEKSGYDLNSEIDFMWAESQNPSFVR